MWKSIGISVIGIVAVTGGLIAWLFSLVDRSNAQGIDLTQPQDIPYVQKRLAPDRGSILIVLTSETEMGDTGKKTGYEHTELSRAYYVFSVNGFEVDIASPKGGEPNAIIDNEDMGALDYAFLNDDEAMAKATHTLPLAEVKGADYEAIYFVGGKGTMWDFPDNPDVHRLVRHFAQQDKLIGAVCHGPAALANVFLDDGEAFLQGKPVTGFTNEEELFLIPDAEQVFPFLLEDRLRERGADVSVGLTYLENIAVTDGLVTGQNPWSVYATAETMIEQLGYTPLPREATAIENSVDVLMQYHLLGKIGARELLDTYIASDAAFDRNLVVMHGLVAAMQWRVKSALELLVIAQHAKTHSAG